MQESDIKFYKAKANGRMGSGSSYEITSGARENVFDRVQRTERENGSTVTEKIFIKVANDNDEPLYSAKPWLDAPSAGDDWEYFVAGTQRNVVGDLTGSERKYATAALKTDVLSGVNSAVFTLEDATLASAFADTYQCILSKKPDGAETAGTEEPVTISGTPSLSGVDLTVTFSAPLANGYTVAEGARLSVLYVHGDVETVMGTVVKTTGSGTLDESQIALDSIGTVEQTITLTFTDATTFTVVSDDADIGTLASGTIGSNYAPQNGAFSKPYLTIPSSAWGGTWAAGNTVVIPMSPAAIPLFVTRKVPVGAAVGYSVPQIVVEGDY